MDAGPPTAASTRTFRVFRFKRDGAPSRIEDFDVPVEGRTTVLEALRWIRTHRDPSLGFRHSCLHASCGTCGMRVNGREALACVTTIDALGDGSVVVEPLANLPVLEDLVVDMAPLFERFPEPHPLVRSSEFVPDAEPPSGIDAHSRFEDCIECGLCLSACPVAATDDTYMGPAALAYAQRLLEEDRGADRAAILAWADDDHAAWRCHAAFECTEACPSDVRPAQRIMALRRELTLRRKVT
ncbi:MAG TPA: succinate dehydrogenase/fumarate reductase iron-sulfur subunit [Actinomycetota bacterium]|jgi:succinate dehydrogenase / fumarate reductase iron-sulfur subunit|nr:succinate dehydrogenase/fumarate reductase iron-sulfur subunit [Actinomycetota bacterium]